MMNKKVFLILFLSFLCHATGQKDTVNEEVENIAYADGAGTPVITNVAPVSSCQISVTWSCNGCANFIDRYTVNWSGPDSEDGNEDVGTKTNYVIDQLMPATIYDIYVTASFLNSSAFNSSTVTNTTNKGEPQSVPGFKIDDTTDTRIYLSWLNSTNKCPIKGFYITWNGRALWEGDQTSGGHYSAKNTANTYTIANLIPYADYTVSIQEETFDEIKGEESSEDTTTYQGKASMPLSLTTDTLNSSSININWEDPTYPNGIITGFNIKCHADGSNAVLSVNTTDENVHNITISELSPCETYNISVSAINGAGYGNYDSTKNSTDESDIPAPNNLKCIIYNSTDSPNDYINITFDDVETECQIAGYFIYTVEQVLWNNDEINEPSRRDSQTNEVVIIDVTPYSSYDISVNAYTLKSDGNVSRCHVVSYEKAPEEPESIEIEEGTLTSSSFTVVWSDPIAKNGILKDFVVVLLNETGHNVTEDNVPYTDYADEYYTYNFSNLISGQNYTVEICAENGAGLGTPQILTVPSLEEYEEDPISMEEF